MMMDSYFRNIRIRTSQDMDPTTVVFTDGNGQVVGKIVGLAPAPPETLTMEEALQKHREMMRAYPNGRIGRAAAMAFGRFGK